MKKKNYDTVVICQVFYPELVSTGQTLTELVEELSDMGLSIKVIASQPTIISKSRKVDKLISYKGIEIVRTWSTRFPKMSFIGKFFNLLTFFFSACIHVLIRNRKDHLILLTNPPYLPLLGWFSNILFKTSYGVVLFDIMPEQAELIDVIKQGGFISKIWKYSNSLWYKKASYVIVLSRDMLEGALSNANLIGHKCENKCRTLTNIIHIWSDDRIIRPINKNNSSETLRLGLSDKFVIQYSGNLGRFHDIETLLKIIEKFENDEKVYFQFIGEGQKKRYVLEFQNKRSLANMYVSSYVDKDVLPHSLAMADMGVVAQMPGQERVCYPSKLLGVMAAGKAILAVCPLSCDMAKMIIDNNLGYVIENGDIDAGIEVIKKAVSNTETTYQMGKNSFDYLQKNFKLHDAALKYRNLIIKHIRN